MQIGAWLRNKNREAVLSAFDWLQTLIFALVTITLLLAFALRVVGVMGDSMLPTLTGGDRLLLSCLSDDYGRGDIVVIDRYTDEPLIKRVVAVAGDTVAISSDCRLCINGIPQTESYTIGITVPRDMTDPVTVPQGCVFVLGDNRTVSKDSRQHEVGMVNTKDIVGKVVYRLWPIGSFGDVY